MPRVRRSRARIIVPGALGASLAGLAVLVAGGLAAPGTPDLPDLKAQLTTNYPPSVDIDTEPGHMLLRFDSVIRNDGGALDIYRDAGPNGGTFQYVYSGGIPNGPQDPTKVPSAPGGTTRSLASAPLTYSYRPGHDHWHFPQAAEYQLRDAAGNLVAPGAKNGVGFCMYDSYDTGGTKYYDPASDAGPGVGWCRPGDDSTGAVTRMGISPGLGDYYFASLADQWVDVTGVAPGAYTLWMRANPTGSIAETTTANNDTQIPVTVPGTLVSPASSSTAVGAPVSIQVAAQSVGADVRSRRDASCDMFNPGCFQTADGTFTFAIATKPANGDATVVSPPGPTATIRYTPRPGFSGTDTFTYTATDSRRLASAPATVTVTVGGPAAGSGAPAAGGARTSPSASAAAKRAKALAKARRLRVSLLVSRRVGLGHRGRVTVKLSAASRGSKVRVLARHGRHGKWTTVASGTLGRSKTIRLTLKRLPRGTYTLKAAVRVGHTTRLSAAERLTVARRV